MAEYWRRRRQARGLHIRFFVYANAFEANNHEIAWQPGVDVRALLQAGGRALRDMGRATDKPALDAAVVELDRVVRALAAADDWTRKLAPLLRSLTPSARQAFDELVKRGCVPLELATCLEAQTQFVETEDAFRHERLAYLPRLKDMEREFRRLSRTCKQYLVLRETYSRSKYPLRQIVPVWLSAQADLMRDFVRDADARRKDKIRYGESLILATMTRTRNAITGRFEDTLFAQLLAGAHGGRPMTAESLKRWRTRTERKWKNWRAPRWWGQSDDEYPRLVADSSEAIEIAAAAEKASSVTRTGREISPARDTASTAPSPQTHRLGRRPRGPSDARR
jgi:hypothetical protein